MVTIDEMKECIQEWMGQTRAPVELARTYAEIYRELDRQLEICMDCLTVNWSE